MEKIVLELPYWPPVSWLAMVWSRPVVALEACEHFQKGSYRNRCHIAGPNGLQRLSIPLQKGKHQQSPIREVRLAYDEPWQQIHWRSIRTAYGNAPFFEHLSAEIEGFYSRRYTFLFDFNWDILQFLLRKINWAGQLECTEVYQPGPLAFRDTVSPKSPTPPDGFRPAFYPQVFLERHGFLPDLSALDLLFCCGKQSTAVLEQSIPGFPHQP